jgi:hypothetical protein
MRAMLLVLLAFLLVGCPTLGRKKPVKVETSIGKETVAAFDAAAEREKIRQELAQLWAALMSKVTASVKATGFANQHNADGLPKQAVQKENELTQSLLKDTPMTVQDQLEAMERVNLVLKNNLEEANKRYQTVATEADRLRQAISAKDAEVATANKKVDDLLAAAKAAEARQKAELDAAFKLKDEEILKARDEERSKRMGDIQKMVTGAGVLVMLAGIGALVFSRGQEPILAGLSIACGAGMIGLAVVIDQDWFPYAFAGVALIGLTTLGIFVFKQRRKVTVAEKTTASVQDIKDAIEESGDSFWEKLEAAKAAGKSPWDVLSEYFDYRFQDSPEVKIFLEKWMVNRGINAKGGLSAPTNP